MAEDDVETWRKRFQAERAEKESLVKEMAKTVAQKDEEIQGKDKEILGKDKEIQDLKRLAHAQQQSDFNIAKKLATGKALSFEGLSIHR